MNKRELIKALFKDPTIKALYESGHFNATDINRAILTEVEQRSDGSAIDNTEQKNIGQLIKTLNAIAKKIQTGDEDEWLSSSFKFEEFIVAKDNIRPVKLQNIIFEYLDTVEKQFIASKDGLTNIEEDNPNVGPAITAVSNALADAHERISEKTDAEGGEKTGNDSVNSEETVDKIEELSNVFDQVFPNGLDFVKAPDFVDGKKPYKYEEEGAPLIQKMRKAIVIDVLSDESVDIGQAKLKATQAFNKKIKPNLKGVPEYITKEYVVSDEFKNSLIGQFNDMRKSFEERKDSIQPAAEKEAQVGQETITKLEQFLSKTEGLLERVNEHPNFKKLLAAEYDKVTQTPESSEKTAEPTTPDGDNSEKENPSEPEAQSESINRALSGIFLLENEENTEPSENEAGPAASPTPDPTPNPTDNKEGGEPISVADAGKVEKMLKDLKRVFKAAGLTIDVQAIWKLSQQKEEPENKQGPSMDDESPPDPAKFQENWTEVLMTFFGKNPNKSSFMKRLLLRSQAEMLYGVIDVLEQVTNSNEMLSLTNMNLDDERENKAEKPESADSTPAQPETGAEESSVPLPETLQRENEDFKVDNDDVERTKPVQKASMKKTLQGQTTAQPDQPQPEPEVQSDKVELPAKTRRIIKQDLQSMVDLLRQLKLTIKDYSMYATRKSADPRFDGSKLKVNMDELLAQVQDDVYDLHSNLKPMDLEPETDDQSIEEALTGIMLEEDDPERQAKIQFVRETYDKAKEEYIYVLMPSMEKGVWDKSQASAKKILETLKEEKFISLFPTALKTTGGRVMTLSDAYKSMTALIQEFIETVRDIVLISKKKYISGSSLTQAKNNLKKISIEIAELFRVPSKFSPEEIKQAKEEEATDSGNKALTPEPENELEAASGDNNPGASSDEDTETGDPSADEQPSEPEPQMDQQQSQKRFRDYISSSDAIKEIKSVKGRYEFIAFVQTVLMELLIQRISESFWDNYKGRFRTTYSNMEKVIDSILRESGLPKNMLKGPIEKAFQVQATYESLLKYMSVKDLTSHAVKYFKNENLFKLLLLENKLTTSFTSLVTILNMDNEGTLERNTDGKDPLPKEYVEKIISKQYPVEMSDKSLTSLLKKALGGDLGLDIANHFNKKIKSLFTLKQKDPMSGYNPKDTDDLESYLFDPISEINALSNIKDIYGKYVSLYLANVYEQFANKSFQNRQEKFKISDSHDSAYGKKIGSMEEIDSFIEKYDKVYNEFKKHFKEIAEQGKELNDFIIDVLDANFATQGKLDNRSDDQEAKDFMEHLRDPNKDPILRLSRNQIYQLASTIKRAYPDKNKENEPDLEEVLKPIIEAMLREHYNH